MNCKIAASIVLYNPDLDRLNENIKSISMQVEKVILVDNASDSTEIAKFENSKCVLLRNQTNVGLAQALNQAMQYAYEQGFDWVLTLDQDSVSQEDLVEGLKRHIDKERIGIIAPKFIDRNCPRLSDDDCGWKYVLRCITSASLTNVKIWKTVGGFDNSLFIDYVDYAFCAKIIRNGFAIIKDSDVSLLHEIGRSKRIFIFNKYSYILYNHSPMRDYYIVRNTLYYCYAYPDVWNVKQDKRELILRCVMILAFEKDKMAKFCSMLKGWKDSRKLIKVEKEKKREIRETVRQEIKDKMK